MLVQEFCIELMQMFEDKLSRCLYWNRVFLFSFVHQLAMLYFLNHLGVNLGVQTALMLPFVYALMRIAAINPKADQYIDVHINECRRFVDLFTGLQIDDVHRADIRYAYDRLASVSYIAWSLLIARMNVLATAAVFMAVQTVLISLAYFGMIGKSSLSILLFLSAIVTVFYQRVLSKVPEDTNDKLPT